MRQETAHTLSLSNIAQALLKGEGGRDTAAGIAHKLQRSLRYVREELHRLVDTGELLQIQKAGKTLYALAPKPKPPVDVTKTKAKAKKKTDEPRLGDLLDDARARLEVTNAEEMWRARLGKRRWQDDPRSLAETQTHPEIFRGRITGGFEGTLAGVSSVYG